MRVCVVGLGTVGRWLVDAVGRLAEEPRDGHRVAIEIVAVANARDGFVHRADGLDPSTLAGLVASGRPPFEYPGTSRWPTSAEGLREVEADLLIETSASPAGDGEPGLTHMREALDRSTGVITSNKWPVALAGVELAEAAFGAKVPFRAEATVMSGTPVLTPLTEGLSGAKPRALRGVLNATVNAILTDVRDGASYADALDAARAAGLAEPDPSADVDGHDSVAKLMILSALVFGRQLRVEDVARRGISDLSEEELSAARGARTGVLREVANLVLSHQGEAQASVEPRLVEPSDPLATVDGRRNAVVCTAAPLGEVLISGPGAGPELAGQGCLSDLLSVARWE